MKPSKIIIFTDLDGSLLDHDTYSFEGAIKTLKKIKKRDIPLILTSSKTRFEIEKITKKLNLETPFIVENGAAIFFPEKYKNILPKDVKKVDNYFVIVLGKEYEEILSFKKDQGLKGFSDLSEKEIASLTNLSLEDACLAKKREFSEPFLLENQDLKILENKSKKYGLKITKGGRFYHLIGQNQDKGKALEIVKEIFERFYNQKVLTIGIGDSQNDFEMLRNCDIPILIKRYDGSFVNIDVKNLIKSKYSGSKGWGESVWAVLKREDAKEIFFAGVDAVLPQNIIKNSIKLKENTLIIENREFELNRYKNIYLLGAGKASTKMAEAVYELIGKRIKKGVVVGTEEKNIGNIKILKGSHPIPDENSLNGANEILGLVDEIEEDDLAIFLLSGGASALMEKPIEPITLQDLQKTNELLLKSGADIDDINIVRKHISMIKGGKLAYKCKAEAIVLVISDVIGDHLETIGSAPCYYDKYSFEDAEKILHKYKIFEKVPKCVREVIEKGIKGEIEDTPKKESAKIPHFIIASNKKALKYSSKKAKELGYVSHIVTSKMCGEAKDVAKDIIKRVKDVEYFKGFVLLFGGETTVKVKGNGKGGRNQEMTLTALLEIEHDEKILFLSGGSDGIDGNSDVAGAVADYKIYEKSKELALDIEKFLNNNDSYTFFKNAGGLLITGYTGTNVMDIAMIIKDKD